MKIIKYINLHIIIKNRFYKLNLYKLIIFRILAEIFNLLSFIFKLILKHANAQ